VVARCDGAELKKALAGLCLCKPDSTLLADLSMQPETSKLRVIKKISPGSRGGLKLARKYGDALVCVRHRMDERGEFRYTTVELLVDKTPVRPRVEAMVSVRIGYKEGALRSLVKAAGASWDGGSKLWKLPRRIAKLLRLEDRIVVK
jgi:hypothetical protein